MLNTCGFVGDFCAIPLSIEMNETSVPQHAAQASAFIAALPLVPPSGTLVLSCMRRQLVNSWNSRNFGAVAFSLRSTVTRSRPCWAARTAEWLDYKIRVLLRLLENLAGPAAFTG